MDSHGVLSCSVGHCIHCHLTTKERRASLAWKSLFSITLAQPVSCAKTPLLDSKCSLIEVQMLSWFWLSYYLFSFPFKPPKHSPSPTPSLVISDCWATGRICGTFPSGITVSCSLCYRLALYGFGSYLHPSPVEMGLFRGSSNVPVNHVFNEWGSIPSSRQLTNQQCAVLMASISAFACHQNVLHYNKDHHNILFVTCRYGGCEKLARTKLPTRE